MTPMMPKPQPKPLPPLFCLYRCPAGEPDYAEWGRERGGKPTGPLLFGSEADANRFATAARVAEQGYSVVSTTSDVMLAEARRRGWVDFWTCSLSQEPGEKPVLHALSIEGLEKEDTTTK